MVGFCLTKGKRERHTEGILQLTYRRIFVKYRLYNGLIEKIARDAVTGIISYDFRDFLKMRV